MPQIRKNADVVTQITTIKVPRDNQSEVLALMAERARFMATQPGFVSVSLHRSEDGSHVVNYVQWKDREQLAAAHHSPEFRKEVAALRRAHQGGGAVPLPGRPRRAGVSAVFPVAARQTASAGWAKAQAPPLKRRHNVARLCPRRFRIRASPIDTRGHGAARERV